MSVLIRWNKVAEKQFNEAVEYIEEDSLQNAVKIGADLLNSIAQLCEHPERYAKDKFKIENDGSFRAFELHHYRISYRYIKNEIRILRIRHTSRCPKPY